VNWREHFKDMQAAMARELELVVDNAGILMSMDGAGFPWITVLRTTPHSHLFGLKNRSSSSKIVLDFTDNSIACWKNLLCP
jgi:hypothetical protein